jgi:ribosomal protein L22
VAPSKNSHNIYPIQKAPKKHSAFKQIMGLDLPIMEKIKRQHSVKSEPSADVFDDRISSNRLNLSVNREKRDLVADMQEKYDTEERKRPFILGDKPKKTFRTFTFNTQILDTTVKKSKFVARALIGRAFYDAIVAGEASQKKPGKFLSNQMDQYMMDKIKEAGFDPKYMFITSIITHRKSRQARIRFHARGKSGRWDQDTCYFKITVTEKPIEEYYKMLINGKSPMYLSFMMRDRLGKDDADYETIRDMQPFLTAKGRQQQRLMFRRKALTRWLEYKREGRFVRFSIVKDLVLEEEVKLFATKYGHLFRLPEQLREERMVERKRLIEKMK